MKHDTMLIVTMLALALGHLSDGWTMWVWYVMSIVFGIGYVAITIIDEMARRDRKRRLSEVEF